MAAGLGKGWIGFELGHRSIVIAQLQRSSTSLRISAACEMPRTCRSFLGLTGLDGYVDVSKPELETARLLVSGLVGKAAASVVPLSVTELTHTELPPADPHEHHAMVASELDFTTPHRFEFWPSDLPGGERSTGLLDVNVISIAESRAAAVAEALRAARFECRVLDSLPHAVARAVLMALPGHLGRSLAALYLGFDHAMFVVSRDGMPVFVRQFRNAGMHRMVARVGQSLGLLEEEAVHVLRELGLPDATDEVSRGDRIQDVLAEIVAEPLEETADELRRTLSYLSTARLGPILDGVCLLGDGAAIANFGRHLALKADTRLWDWNLPGADASVGAPHLPPALFAVASALSGLAWNL